MTPKVLKSAVMCRNSVVSAHGASSATWNTCHNFPFLGTIVDQYENNSSKYSTVVGLLKFDGSADGQTNGWMDDRHFMTTIAHQSHGPD